MTDQTERPADRVRDRELMGEASGSGLTNTLTDAAPTDAAPTDAADPALVIGAAATSRLGEDEVLEALKDVVDPELGINVVDLGLIYGVHVEDDTSVVVDMTLTSAACPLTDVIEAQADAALEGMVNALHINWVWMPPWTAAKITDDGRDQLRAMGFNV